MNPYHNSIAVPGSSQEIPRTYVVLFPDLMRQSWDWRERTDCRIECLSRGNQHQLGGAVQGRLRAFTPLSSVISARWRFDHVFVRFRP